MIHRLHNWNVGYGNNLTNTLANNQAALNATEGATALDFNNVFDENEIVQQKSEQEEIKKEPSHDPLLENVSIESATYMENTSQTEENFKNEDEVVKFEVDSIELATPELQSNDLEGNLLNQENNEEELKVFENSNPKKETEIKEPEMFEESNLEEDFEIPAFLRRQKN